MLTTATSPNSCTDGIALARGVAAIVEEYPWLSANKSDYIVRAYPRMYLVLPKIPGEQTVGNEQPNAPVDKETCQVINVFLTS
ncbi:hypothetical protein MO867_18355 [Microbulbifer sp. OS29]|uniref:Uncharacterized protein n=1 Tax=Microbulbifer okhotskensis TaxID=2926617 RepID=A0A9X2J6I0_9GAMM|nr:hypothetical protein [Microbulbifer okhotskensis]MCO1336298.1 hypothetical protein [Microbulbifer okhotskensis]